MDVFFLIGGRSGISKATFLEGFSAFKARSCDRAGSRLTPGVHPSSIFAFWSSRSMREGLSPVSNSFLASSISSGDIFAIRCLFSSSIPRVSSALAHSPPPISAVTALSFLLGVDPKAWGDGSMTFAEFLVGGGWLALPRLKVDCRTRILWAGKPVSALLFPSSDGDFAVDGNDRSLISPTRLKAVPAEKAGFGGSATSASSSEDRSTLKR